MKIKAYRSSLSTEKYKSKGFTIVELLLGLAIGAIIGLCVYNTFWSAMKLDDRMRRIHDNYMELLMANQGLTHDLENAINLDLSASYPDAKVFEGNKTDFSFLTQTPKGIKRVQYYSGLSDQENVTKTMIGRVVNSSNFTNESSPVEFLMRRESSLADWLNETSNNVSIQVVAAGLKKGSFNCRYAPYTKDLHNSGAQGIDYQDSWDSKGLPLAVSCRFILFDSRKPLEGLNFKRDVFLAPVASYHNEQ